MNASLHMSLLISGQMTKLAHLNFLHVYLVLKILYTFANITLNIIIAINTYLETAFLETSHFKELTL